MSFSYRLSQTSKKTMHCRRSEASRLHGGSIPPISTDLKTLAPARGLLFFRWEMSETTACLAWGNRRPQRYFRNSENREGRPASFSSGGEKKLVGDEHSTPSPQQKKRPASCRFFLLSCRRLRSNRGNRKPDQPWAGRRGLNTNCFVFNPVRKAKLSMPNKVRRTIGGTRKNQT